MPKGDDNVRRDSRPIIIERSGGSVWWFLVGGALGAGLALLFAPQSGDRTRRVVGRKLSKLRDAADVALEDLRDALSPEERVHRSLAEREPDHDDDEVAAPGTPHVRGDGEPDHGERETPRRGSASARRELEQRLSEARARRQRALADEDEEPVA
jgi:YtxH-like protein